MDGRKGQRVTRDRIGPLPLGSTGSVARPFRIVGARSRLAESHVRADVWVPSRLPPSEPCVSVRLSTTNVEDGVRNKQRETEHDREDEGRPDIHCSAPSGASPHLNASSGPVPRARPGAVVNQFECRRNRHADQGQVLYWFLFRFHGADDVVDVRDGKEAKHWRWMSFAAVLAGVTGFRRPMYQRLSQEFNEHL